MTKGAKNDVSLCVPSNTTVSKWRKGVRNYHNLSSHVIGPAASGSQKTQKTTLVSACHRTRLCLNGEKVCKMTIICLRMSLGPPPLDDKKAQKTTLVSVCHRTRLCLNGEKVCGMTIICHRTSSGPPPLDDKRRRRRRKSLRAIRHECV